MPEQLVGAKKVLMVYSGVYGHTLKICETMQPVLESRGAAVTLAALSEEAPDPSGFDALMIGAAIRKGKHNPAVLDFIERHRALLEEKVSAFFSVNLVARKPDKNTPETNPYVRAFLKTNPWQPRQVAIFGGRTGAMWLWLADTSEAVAWRVWHIETFKVLAVFLGLHGPKWIGSRRQRGLVMSVGSVVERGHSTVHCGCPVWVGSRRRWLIVAVGRSRWSDLNR